MLLIISGIVAIIGFIVWVVYRFRSDGAAFEKLKNKEAINDQNDELLEYLKKEKDFIHRLQSSTPDERKRLCDIINGDKK